MRGSKYSGADWLVLLIQLLNSSPNEDSDSIVKQTKSAAAAAYSDSSVICGFWQQCWWKVLTAASFAGFDSSVRCSF